MNSHIQDYILVSNFYFNHLYVRFKVGYIQTEKLYRMAVHRFMVLPEIFLKYIFLSVQCLCHGTHGRQRYFGGCSLLQLNYKPGKSIYLPGL